MENKKRTGLLLSALGVLSLVLITAGVTYAFFNYAKEGQTSNTISTGTIKFTYTETDTANQGVLIENALPLTDVQGMALSNTDNADRNSFNFRVTGDTTGNTTIPYIVTARKSSSSTLAESQVKVYLTASQSGTNNTVNGNAVKTFAELRSSNLLANDATVWPSMNTEGLTADSDEVVLYSGTASGTNYTNNFVLRMWLNGTGASAIDYSPYEFVLASAIPNGATANDALTFATLKANGKIIKSTDYYSKTATRPEEGQTGHDAADGTYRDDYVRISYVNQSDGTLFAVGQTPTSTDGYTATEQYYETVAGNFSLTVNVYAKGATTYTYPTTD